MKRNETNRIRSLKKSADYLKKSVIWVVVALILAAASAIITIIGPDKVGEIANVISDGLLGEIDLAAITVLFKRGVLVFADLYNGGRNA